MNVRRERTPLTIGERTALTRLTELTSYSDDRGNVIEYDGEVINKNISIEFRGTNNRLIVESPTRIAQLRCSFDADSGIIRLGSNDRPRGSAMLRLSARVGLNSQILCGQFMTSTVSCYMTAAEGQTIHVGEDCMFASNNQIRAHDGHPIFHLDGRRANPSRSITIGNHVWVGAEAVILGGTEIGDGSVIGFRSVVTRRIPNNAVAVGIPAKVVQKNIAWERPNLTLSAPYAFPEASSVRKSAYWHPTNEPAKSRPARLMSKVRRLLGCAVRQLNRK